MARPRGLSRLPDWEDRLRIYIRDTVEVPFESGVQDCAVWCAGAVQAMTTTDLLSGLRGDWSTPEQAFAVMQHRGWATLRDALAELVGEPIPPIEARYGDLIWMPPGVSSLCTYPIGTLGVYFLRERIVSPTYHRLAFLPIRPMLVHQGLCAFAVGER